MARGEGKSGGGQRKLMRGVRPSPSEKRTRARGVGKPNKKSLNTNKDGYAHPQSRFLQLVEIIKAEIKARETLKKADPDDLRGIDFPSDSELD